MILVTQAHVCDRCHTTVLKTFEEGVARRTGFYPEPLTGWRFISNYHEEYYPKGSEKSSKLYPFVYACPDCVKHHVKMYKLKQKTEGG